MITYTFPPVAGSGVFRTLKFVKYLPTFDWQPIILSIKKSKTKPTDKTLEKEIPTNVKVYRTTNMESKIYRYAASYCKINPKWYQIPDWRFIEWFPFAVLKAKKIIKKEKPDVIYSTSPPPTSHLIALAIKLKTGLPWVADYRDPWTQHFEISYPTRIHRNIEENLEHKIAKYADKIIFITSLYRSNFLNKYPDTLQEKCITITNGYDPDDFINVKVIKSDKFIISHLGSLYGRRSPSFFLEALINAIKERETLETDIEVKFVGGSSKEYWDIANKYGLDGIVREVGYVPHEKAIKCMVDSTCLLLVIGAGRKNKEIFTGKIFEYVASRTPIIATVPLDGVAADLIKETNSGLVLDTNDVNGIKTAILEFYDKWKEGKLKIDSNSELIKKYSRKELTKKLAEIFDDISGP